MDNGLRLLISVSLSLVLVACGDDSATPDAGTDSGSDAGVDASADTGDDAPGDAGSDVPGDDAGDDAATDALVDAPSEGPCPASLPEAAAECGVEGLICEYGERICLATAECTGGTWAVSTPRCPPPPTGGCPDTRELAEGSACAGDDGSLCEYPPGLICRCTTCPNPFPVCMMVDPPVWACEAPNPDDTCPAAQPLLGTVCAMDTQICDYGCEAGERRICSGGVWTPGSQPGGCPMSTRRAKRDIDYLEVNEVDALAEEVRRTRLTTYEYTDPALAGRRHLGFIIEDQPHAFSVDPERSQVDLYGYASMLVAAIQAQDRRIEALERQLEERQTAETALCSSP